MPTIVINLLTKLQRSENFTYVYMVTKYLYKEYTVKIREAWELFHEGAQNTLGDFKPAGYPLTSLTVVPQLV